ncbi:hypothetical protein Tco_0542893 [Tanacetum coccineum]
MHGVRSLLLTGNYMPTHVHVEIDKSQFSYGQKQTNISETSSENVETYCDFHEKRMAQEQAMAKQNEKTNGMGNFNRKWDKMTIWENTQRVDPSNKIVPHAVLLQSGIVDLSSTRPNLSTPVPTGRQNLSKPVTTGRRNLPTTVPTGKAVPAGRPNYPIPVTSGRTNNTIRHFPSVFKPNRPKTLVCLTPQQVVLGHPLGQVGELSRIHRWKCDRVVTGEERLRKAHQQHGNYFEDGERLGGDLETNYSSLHAMRSAIHANGTEEESQSHRAFKQRIRDGFVYAPSCFVWNRMNKRELEGTFDLEIGVIFTISHHTLQLITQWSTGLASCHVERQGESWHGHVTVVIVPLEFHRKQLAKKLMIPLKDINDKML